VPEKLKLRRITVPSTALSPGRRAKAALAGRRDEALAYVLNPGPLRKVSLTSI